MLHHVVFGLSPTCLLEITFVGTGGLVFSRLVCFIVGSSWVELVQCYPDILCHCTYLSYSGTMPKPLHCTYCLPVCLHCTAPHRSAIAPTTELRGIPLTNNIPVK